MDIRIQVPEANSQKVGPVCYTCHTETSFAESKLNFLFCPIYPHSWYIATGCLFYIAVYYLFTNNGASTPQTYMNLWSSVVKSYKNKTSCLLRNIFMIVQ